MLTASDILVFQSLAQALGLSALIGGVLSALLLIKSLVAFTLTGPSITGEVSSHYRAYLVYALGRLTFAAFLILTALAFLGAAAYSVGLVLFASEHVGVWAGVAAFAAVAIFTSRAFVRALFYNPGVIVSSSQFSMGHFYALWERLSPTRLRLADGLLFGGLGAWFAAGLIALGSAGAWAGFLLVSLIVAIYVPFFLFARWDREPPPPRKPNDPRSPNILLIGADTLRADRLGGGGYPRDLTPNLDRFARRATRFTDCYVPCARTAPSLASLLTSTWPHTHGIRDNFVTPSQTDLPVTALPELLRREGYRTAAVGDWAASDITKFEFGFDEIGIPEDQWNIKYLLRQGPKDMRLFLALFTQNWFGKRFLPELYYLGGHPLAEEVGRDTRAMIAELAEEDAPFFLMSFMATTHPPFASKFPYYAMYADRGYRGPSKFAMAKLRDPFEIIRSQGEPKTEFDLEQIIDLYDGCVKNFDDEFQRVLDYLDASGLADNTIVAVFSDHGFEFFEHETWGQGNSAIGDFSARVPLLIADPRHPQPHVVTNVVRTVDLAPTLLELLGKPVPPFMEGRSLAPAIRGEALTEDLPAFYETGVWLTDLPGTPKGHLRYPSLPEMLEVPDKRLGMISLQPRYHDIIVAAKDRMVRLGQWKLSYQPLYGEALYQLFNVREDPACRHNVLEENPKVARHLIALLQGWMAADDGVSKGAEVSTTPGKRVDSTLLGSTGAAAKT
jgi:arylsulfatase A-like enzyme